MEENRVATIEDCMEMYEIKGKCAVISDGHLLGFEYEKSAETDGKSDQR